jgi:hypothetical protein
VGRINLTRASIDRSKIASSVRTLGGQKNYVFSFFQNTLMLEPRVYLINSIDMTELLFNLFKNLLTGR